MTGEEKNGFVSYILGLQHKKGGGRVCVCPQCMDTECGVTGIEKNVKSSRDWGMEQKMCAEFIFRGLAMRCHRHLIQPTKNKGDEGTKATRPSN